MAKQFHDLSAQAWTLRGLPPWLWLMGRSSESGAEQTPEAGPVPARVPGSVQSALRAAGLLPDWFAGLNALACEWVEHRDWVFETELPDAWLRPGARHTLVCDGLDGPGEAWLNGLKLGAFDNAFVPHAFALERRLRRAGNRLQLVFHPPERWLGQIGRTSRMRALKPRFNYTWDWVPRIVQLGPYGGLRIETCDGPEIAELAVRASVAADGTARLALRAALGGERAARGWQAVLTLAGPDGEILRKTLAADRGVLEFAETVAPVRLWWPAGLGAQELYTVTLALVDPGGQTHDRAARTVGFRRIQWAPCAGAPPEADPWLCVVNGRSVFLRGVNWTPVRPTFADVPADETVRRVELYRELGCNLLRVWGGAVLESEAFYDACDRLGLLVWQEFPLSSSGVDNWPPEDRASVRAFTGVARSYVARRAHHAALLLWCGGNELQGALDGGKTGGGKPVGLQHPLLRAFEDVVKELDPERRFVPTSPTGPRFYATPADFGKGLHWEVHGPWKLVDDTLAGQRGYFAADDALFRSEVGAPGASPLDTLEAAAGGLALMPPSRANPLWARFSWWIELPDFVREHGREPQTLAEFVAWSQQRQAEGLRIAAQACVDRFPACGGFVVWMGHDCFPCTANTSIVDFQGRPKPAALALQSIFAGLDARLSPPPARNRSVTG